MAATLPTVVLVAAKTVTVVLGTVLTLLAARAFRRTAPPRSGRSRSASP